MEKAGDTTPPLLTSFHVFNYSHGQKNHLEPTITVDRVFGQYVAVCHLIHAHLLRVHPVPGTDLLVHGAFLLIDIESFRSTLRAFAFYSLR